MKQNRLTHKLIKRFHLFVIATLLAGLGLGLSPPPVAHAATIDVAADLVEVNDDDDQCSLIEAIENANSTAINNPPHDDCAAGDPTGADTIVLSAGATYTLTVVNNDTDGPNGLPSITSVVAIQGNDATIQRSSVGGTPDFRIFHVGSNGDLTLNDLTVRNGKTPNGPDGSDSSAGNGGPGGTGDAGGGIYNAGTLTLNSSTVSNNNTGNGGVGGDSSNDDSGAGGNGGPGGGIYNSGTLALNSSHLTDNSTGSGGRCGSDNVGYGYSGHGGPGGGIYTFGTLTLNSSIVSNNNSGSGGASCGENAVGGDGGDGGGIYNSGTLALNSGAVSNNNAGNGGDGGSGGSGNYGLLGGDGGSGGGIRNSGILTVTNSIISANTTGSGGPGGNGGYRGYGCGGHGGHGGGICSTGGTAQLTNNTISANTTGSGGPGGNGGADSGANGGDAGNGGGIYKGGGAAQLTNNTISANTTGAGGDGGALYSPVSDCYLPECGADGGDAGDGGGIFNKGGGVTQLTNNTISANTTGAGGDGGTIVTVAQADGLGGGGGGIFKASAGTTNLKNTILAGNSAAGSGPDCSGTLTSQNYNLLGNDLDCTLTPPVADDQDQVGTEASPLDPRLDALALNAPGNTETHALFTDSPAIDQIPNGVNGCGTEVADDQRGVARPQAGGCDTGAFEEAVRGTIIVEKQTDPDGAADDFDFTDDIESPFSFSLGDGGTEIFYAWPRTYTVTEIDPGPGFDLTDITCSDNNSTGDIATGVAAISLESSEIVTCTFTNTERGAIVIEKQTDPPGAAGFGFSYTRNPCGADCEGLWFTLDHGARKTLSNIEPGPITITEQVMPGDYELGDLTCVEDGVSNSTADPDNRQAAIFLDPGETVTCTFNNTLIQHATLVIEKQTECAGAIDTFAFAIPNLIPGAYPVTEGGPVPGLNLTDITCDDGASAASSTGDVGARTAFFQLDPGEIVQCTFSNDLLDVTTGDSVGVGKETYTPDEFVYVTGGGFVPNTFVDVYVITNLTWFDGMAIPPDVSGDGMNTVPIDAAGNLGLVEVWSPPLAVGDYDLVIDVNQNGVYDAAIDIVDDPNHPGFVVRKLEPVGGFVAPVNEWKLLALQVGSGQALGMGLVLLVSFAALTIVMVRRRGG